VIEIEPDAPMQLQAAVVRVRQAAAALHETELRIARHAEGGIAAPLRRRICLCGVDAFGALRIRHAQPIAAGKTPDLFRRPDALACRPREIRRDARAARGERDVPASRANLHAKAAVRFEARRQHALEQEWHEPFRQHACEQFFAPVARDLQSDQGDQPHRHLVFHETVDLHFHPFGLLGGASLAEPHGTVRPLRLRDASPVEREIDDRRARIDRDGLGTSRPGQRSGDRMRACWQQQCRTAGPEHHRARCAVDAHVGGPVLRVARQGDPALGEGLPALGEIGAAGVDREHEALGPRASIGRALGSRCHGEERAAPELLTLQDPAAPVLEVRRHRDSRAAALRVRSGGQHECGNQGEQSAMHRKTPSRFARRVSLA
jgi:hypothetical protein